MDMNLRRIFVLIFAVFALSAATGAKAQARLVNGVSLHEVADGVLSLMGYSLTPDVTTGSLSISSGGSGNPNIDTIAFGGGFTVSAELPLYLEGTAGRSLYDPIYLVSQGTAQRSVSSQWRTTSATGGVGWDFPITEELKFRPIFNLSYGRVQTDGSIAGYVYGELTGEEIEFLTGGTLNAVGVGGSLMLDYERYRPKGEVDVELRYTNINLSSTSGSAAAVQGSSDAQSASLWMRWRAPMRMSALGRPVRYVLEAAHTEFLGDLRGVLGFTGLSSLGVGLELDSSAHDIVVTRTRLVVRYQFGGNVQGAAVGLAVSF
jgi:Autotransporter beta-domain